MRPRMGPGVSATASTTLLGRVAAAWALGVGVGVASARHGWSAPGHAANAMRASVTCPPSLDLKSNSFESAGGRSTTGCTCGRAEACEP